MADGSFDYDILTYDVIERVVYANSYDSYDNGWYDSYSGCGYSYFGCGRSYYGSPYSVSVGLFFGRPYYRRHYYDPFYASYDPFYDPFFYDPYYYRPYYYRPVYVYPGYGYPYYNYPYAYGGYYTNRYRNCGQPYTPYRFRPADGVNVGYRDRRYDLPVGEHGLHAADGARAARLPTRARSGVRPPTPGPRVTPVRVPSGGPHRRPWTARRGAARPSADPTEPTAG